MSIASIVTRGFIIGPIDKLVTIGFSISTFIPPTIPTSGGLFDNQSLGNGLTAKQSTGSGILNNQTLSPNLTGRGRL